MLDKLLYSLAEHIVGKNGKVIVDILKDKRDVNEFKIAEKLKLTINQVRNLLYKLDAHDIVSFIRKKDKRKGWYIYYWSLDLPKSLKLLARMKEKEIQQLNNTLKSHENKRFFFCRGCEIELTEENALTHNFICPECGTLLQLSDNRDKILEIKRNIAKESNILKTIISEINKLAVEEAERKPKPKEKGKAKPTRKKEKAKKKVKKKSKKKKIKGKIKKPAKKKQAKKKKGKAGKGKKRKKK